MIETAERVVVPESVPIARRPATLANIQALRALASVMVIFVHLQRMFGWVGVSDGATEMFTAGVDLFFVISGFIMVYTTRRRTPTPFGFLLNRIARLVPIYWLFTLVIFAICLVSPRLFGGTLANPLDLVRSLLFVPYVRADGLMRPLLFVGWSLNLEMMFYVLFAVSLVIPGTVRRVLALAAALLSLVLWHAVAARTMGPVLAFMTQPLILEFAMGMLVAIVLPHLPSDRTAGRVAIVIAPVALVALLICSRVPAVVMLPATALPATILLVAALVAERASFRLDRGWILALGDASYALYLTHPFVTQAITFAALATGAVAAWSAIPLIVLSVLTSIVIALVVHRTVERPLGRVAHYLLVGTRGRRVLASQTSREA